MAQPESYKGIAISLMITRPGESKQLKVITGNIVTIGRATSNSIVLNADGVSDQHATIKITKENTLLLTDMNSSSGSYVNQQRVTFQTPITAHSKIAIGPYTIQAAIEDLSKKNMANEEDEDDKATRISSSQSNLQSNQQNINQIKSQQGLQKTKTNYEEEPTRVGLPPSSYSSLSSSSSLSGNTSQQRTSAPNFQKTATGAVSALPRGDQNNNARNMFSSKGNIDPKNKKPKKKRKHLTTSQLTSLIFKNWSTVDKLDVDNKNAPKIIEIMEIWGENILDAKHFSSSVEHVILADETRKGVDFLINGEFLPSKVFVFIAQVSNTPNIFFSAKNKGVIQIGNQKPLKLEELIANGFAKESKDRRGIFHIPLSADMKFAIQFGRTTIVGTQVYQAKKLSLSSAAEYDIPYAMILVMMTLLTGGMVVWMKSLPPPPPLDITQIPNRFAKLIAPKILDKTEKPPEKKEPEKKPVKTEAKSTPKPEETTPIPTKQPDVEPQDKGKKDPKKINKPSQAELQKAEQDKKVAENAGLLGQLNKADSTLFDSGLNKGLTNAVSGLLGTTGVSQVAGVMGGSKGIGFNAGGGTTEGIGGIHTKGKDDAAVVAKTASIKSSRKKEVAELDLGTGDALILGGLDKATIEKVIKDHIKQIRYCYEKELARNPRLAGKIIIKFLIDKDGAVSSSSIKESTMGSSEVEQCVSTRISQLKFPEPKGGTTVTVSYPFFFKAAG